MSSVVIRVDAGPAIGIGHVSRCLTLAAHLRQAGCQVQFVVRPTSLEVAARLLGDFPVASLPVECVAGGDELADALAMLDRLPRLERMPWVVVDHLEFGERWERTVRSAGCPVLAIDDLREKSHCADVLVSDVELPFAPGGSAAGPSARELLGPAYALVREEFAPHDVVPGAGALRILVSYGGSDPTGETVKALRGIRTVSEATDGVVEGVDVVVGHANVRGAEIAEAVSRMSNATLHVAPGSLAPLLRGCDLFLTAGGHSLLEALTMRRMCLVTVTAENQRAIVSQLLMRRLIEFAGFHAEVDAAGIGRGIAALHGELHQRLAHVRATSPFDLLGARRIAGAMHAVAPLIAAVA